MHVATTRRKYKDKVYTNYLIQQSYREGGKVKHKTISNITHLPPDLIEMIRKRLKQGHPIRSEGFSITRSLPHGHVAAILQLIRQIGLDTMIASTPSQNRNLIIGLIVQRLLWPGSKLHCYRCFRSETATTTLGQALKLDNIPLNAVYQALDWLLKSQARIEQKLASRHLKAGTMVLYDLSGSYYTGQTSDLIQYGYNRDGKKGYPQVVYGLLCDVDGRPVAVEVFSGNTPDSATMGAQIEKVRKRFGIGQVVWVGDRGMITGKLISEELRGQEGLDWITALRAGQVKKLVNQQAIQLSLFDQQDLVEIESPDYKGERLIVCKNPFLAEERRYKRQQLLEATQKELDKIVAATSRKRNPLSGKGNIGVKVGRVIDKYKMGKHIDCVIEEASFTYRVNQASVKEEQALDGLYVIRTSLSSSSYPGEKIVETYKNLARVEWAFRSIKTTLIEIRPIYHWDSDRIRAHIFLCMLAYYVEWHLHKRLAPVLYADDQKQQAGEKRESVVAPAQKSDAALEKAASHKTPEGGPVYSMAHLMEFLGTICQNQLQYEGSEGVFYTITKPTVEQQKILDMLKVKL